MKKKFFSLLLIVFILSSATPVQAANIPEAGTYANNFQTFYGTVYDTILKNMNCYCSITTSTNRVHAMTSFSNVTVTISSKSYTSLSNTSPNGSGGGAGNGTTSTTYTATSYIEYTYQEHAAPTSGKSIGAFLYRH